MRPLNKLLPSNSALGVARPGCEHVQHDSARTGHVDGRHASRGELRNMNHVLAYTALLYGESSTFISEQEDGIPTR